MCGRYFFVQWLVGILLPELSQIVLELNGNSLDELIQFVYSNLAAYLCSEYHLVYELIDQMGYGGNKGQWEYVPFRNKGFGKGKDVAQGGAGGGGRERVPGGGKGGGKGAEQGKGKGSPGNTRSVWSEQRGPPQGQGGYGQTRVRERLVCEACTYWVYKDRAGDACPACKVGQWKRRPEVPKEDEKNEKDKKDQKGDEQDNMPMEVGILRRILAKVPGLGIDFDEVCKKFKEAEEKEKEAEQEVREKGKTRWKRLGEARDELAKANAAHLKASKALQWAKQKKEEHVKASEKAAVEAAAKLDKLDKQLLEAGEEQQKSEKELEEKTIKHKLVQNEPDELKEEEAKGGEGEKGKEVDMDLEWAEGDEVKQQGGGKKEGKGYKGETGKGSRRVGREGRRDDWDEQGRGRGNRGDEGRSRSRGRDEQEFEFGIKKEEIPNMGPEAKELLEKLKTRLREDEEARKEAHKRARLVQQAGGLTGATVEEDRKILEQAEVQAKQEAAAATKAVAEAAAGGANRV